jgi:HSP20 family molecular chaperone IbpA
MLNNLLRLLDNDNFMSRLEKVLETFDERLNQEFNAPFGNVSVVDSGFMDMGQFYELKLNLSDGVTENDINVQIEDDETVNVSAEYENGETKFKFMTMTTLPEDANADSLTAELEDNSVFVRVEKENKPNKTIKVTKK